MGICHSHGDILQRVTFTNQVAIYTGGSQFKWRESSQLPQIRHGLRAATVETGGRDTDFFTNNTGSFTSILSWNPSTEYWQEAGELEVARSYHAAVAVPSSIIESQFKELTNPPLIGPFPNDPIKCWDIECDPPGFSPDLFFPCNK